MKSRLVLAKVSRSAFPLDDNVAGLRGRHVNDRRTPTVFHEGVAVDDALEDPVRVGGDLVVASGEVMGACMIVAPAASRRHEPDRVVQHAGRVHHISDRSVEGASVGEVVLVLDQDDSRGLGIEERLSLIACLARAWG